jgi:hypothetical protein
VEEAMSYSGAITVMAADGATPGMLTGGPLLWFHLTAVVGTSRQFLSLNLLLTWTVLKLCPWIWIWIWIWACRKLILVCRGKSWAVGRFIVKCKIKYDLNMGYWSVGKTITPLLQYSITPVF